MHGDHPTFDNYVDDANGPVRIFDLEYRASEVLFWVDRSAYRDLLSGFTAQPADGASDAAATGGPAGEAGQ